MSITPHAGPEGTPARTRTTAPALGPDLPRGVALMRRRFTPDWTVSLVMSQGVVEGTEPVPNGARKTRDIMIPVGSASLRARRETAAGTQRAVAVWVWRSTTDKWSFENAYLWLQGEFPLQQVSAERLSSIIATAPVVVELVGAHVEVVAA